MFDQTTFSGEAPSHSDLGRPPAWASAPANDLLKAPIDLVLERYEFPFPPKPHQADTINKYGKLDRHGYGWKPGCVDASTEFLTPTGWKRIDQYREGDVVAQYTFETGLATFVTPQNYIKHPCDSMVRIKTKYGLDQMLSMEHRMVGMDQRARPGSSRKENVKECTAQEFLAASQGAGTAAGLGVRHFAIPTVFSVEPGQGMAISEADLLLQVAVIADGHFNSSSNRCVVRVKKQRKIDRLINLLDDANRPYKLKVVTEGTATGFHVFSFEAPIRVKEFDARFWACSMRQMVLIAHEVILWDGSDIDHNRGPGFHSTVKASADFVQFVWTVTGRSSTITLDGRTEKYSTGECYKVSRAGTQRGGPRGLKTVKSFNTQTVSTAVPEDGFMYCFTVPSSYLVLRRNGCIFVTGNCGKTFGTTLHACYLNSVKATKQWVILVPPVVLRNWSRFLEKVIDRSTGKPVTQTLYAGTPQQRHHLSLDSQFIMMSYDIFKRDFDRLEAHFEDRKVGLIADEAHKIKNMETVNYRAVKKLFESRPMLLATGTPITSPDDAYTYMKFTNQKAYRNKRHFEQLHVGERDDYEKVTSWVNLDVLQKNFLVNWTMYSTEDIRSDSQPVTFIPIVYDLDPAHLKLYDKMVEDQMLELDDGRVIDALSASALYHKCQQIVCNWDVFSEDDSKQSAGTELVEEVLDEIGTEKLMVVANYKMTNATLLRRLAPYGAVQIIGGLTANQRNANLDRFLTDPACRVLIIQPEAGGVGLDGLQLVCNEGIFLECPTIPRQFEQAYARLAREGQKRQVNWRIAVANKTIQVKLHRDLLNKDATVVKVTGGVKTLREAIHGT